jgi:FAD/FMN-containing dehydrogenase
VGNTWDAVYSKLDELNLTVTGGRAAGVGVGGLSLGGGISFFGTRHGWTSDTIVNFQMVLANGSIISANEEENPDLAWALRGGSNNFGVVTRVDLRAFEQPPFWGGYFYHPISTWAQAANSFVEITEATTYDEYAHMTLSWGYMPGVGTAVAHGLDYTKPGVENPAIFSDIINLPVLFGASGISNMTRFSFEVRAQQSANGLRYVWLLVSSYKRLHCDD